ncbi:MAG: hypothetical protein P4L26_09670 [Terracidiphilus sp.]|nr:hypothetical protein [Terracidiphilus sp.]
MSNYIDLPRWPEIATEPFDWTESKIVKKKINLPGNRRSALPVSVAPSISFLRAWPPASNAGPRVSLFVPFLPVCSSFRSGSFVDSGSSGRLDFTLPRPPANPPFTAVKPAQFLHGLEEK